MPDILKELANQYLEQSKREQEDENLKARESAIALLENGQAYEQFISDLEQWGTNEKGEPLRIRPWTREYCRFLSDIRLKEKYVSGCAQSGKSLFCIMFYLWLVVEAQLNALYVFAEVSVKDKMLDIQMKPILRYWLDKKGIKLKAKDNVQNKQVIQVKSGNGILGAAGTRNRNNEGRAAASSNIVSFSTDLALCDERSQYVHGAIDPIYRRLDASRLSTQPIILTGTPGSGNGIEAEIDRADHYFYPHTYCPHCGEESSLHPLGNLLKPKTVINEAGEEETSWFSESGKPDNWFYKDENDPIGTAYFACNHCGRELDQESRINSHFTCLYTGKRLTDFLDNLDANDTKNWKCGINISPLLRESSKNVAADIINSGLIASNVADYHQQRLGIPSQETSGNLTIDDIKRCIYAPDPEFHRFQESFVLAGIDTGRSFDYLVVIEYVLPLGWEAMEPEEVIEKTCRLMLFGGAINRSETKQVLDYYEVEHGLIDNEPDRTTSAQLAKDYGFDMADQKENQSDDVKRLSVLDGGQQFDCWGLRTGKFMRQVKNSYLLKYSDGYPLMRLPPTWENWLNNPIETSPIRHMTSVTYDGESGKWIRPNDHNDDTFFANMFCEASFYLKLTGNHQYAEKWFANC